MRQVFAYLALVGVASAISLTKKGAKGGDRPEPTDEQKANFEEFMSHCSQHASEEECKHIFPHFTGFMMECMSQDGATKESCLAEAETHLKNHEEGEKAEGEGDRKGSHDDMEAKAMAAAEKLGFTEADLTPTEANRANFVAVCLEAGFGKDEEECNKIVNRHIFENA